jgi:hypothetical protein
MVEIPNMKTLSIYIPNTHGVISRKIDASISITARTSVIDVICEEPNFNEQGFIKIWSNTVSIQAIIPLYMSVPIRWPRELLR